MANELTTNQTGELVLAMEQHAIGDLLQPLIREIHLFDSFVAGTTHLSDPSVLEEIKVGDQLSLLRENNKFDSNAILILTADKKKLGYVPEKDNIIFARAGRRQDAGRQDQGDREERKLYQNSDWDLFGGFLGRRNKAEGGRPPKLRGTDPQAEAPFGVPFCCPKNYR